MQRADSRGNIIEVGYTNDCLSGSQGRYSTSQSYSYDGLYQLLAVRGDTWVEETSNTGAEFLPYKFTGKELDPETGSYYGAGYLDSAIIAAFPQLIDRFFPLFSITKIPLN